MDSHCESCNQSQTSCSCTSDSFLDSSSSNTCDKSCSDNTSCSSDTSSSTSCSDTCDKSSSCSDTCDTSCSDTCDTSCSDTCDTSSSCSVTCDTSCSDTCDTSSSCSVTCDTSNTCDTSCDTSCSDTSCCDDGVVPSDGPVKCNCKYVVGAILNNDDLREQVVTCLKETYCIKPECTRYLCIDVPPVEHEPISYGHCDEKCPPITTRRQLKLLNSMVRTLAEECVDPIVLVRSCTNPEFLQLFLDGCISTEGYAPFPPVYVRFSMVNFLVYDCCETPIDYSEYPNVKRLDKCCQ